MRPIGCGSAARDEYSYALIDVESALEVLVVDDDIVESHLIYRALAENPRVGDIVLARNGHEALELLDCELVRPDVAIVDFKTLQRNSRNWIGGLRAKGRLDFVVVVLQSSKAQSAADPSMVGGAHCLLNKPDSFDDLEFELARVIAAV